LGVHQPSERIWRFWRIDFLRNSQKSANFEHRVKTDSRRLQTSLAFQASFVSASQRATTTGEVCHAEAFAGFHANAKADKLRISPTHFGPSVPAASTISPRLRGSFRCPSPTTGSLRRAREPPDQQFLYEVVNLLPVCDPGERRVLPADEDASVQHDGRQEASLTLCETEMAEKLGRSVVAWFGPREIRRCLHSRTLDPWTVRSQ
jgi:hypothetical protein